MPLKYERSICGDILLVCDSGVQIFPNIYARKVPALAMHGYAPIKDEEDGLLIINSPRIKRRKKKDVNLVDIMPIILSLLKLPIPSSVEGRNLLKK